MDGPLEQVFCPLHGPDVVADDLDGGAVDVPVLLWEE